MIRLGLRYTAKGESNAALFTRSTQNIIERFFHKYALRMPVVYRTFFLYCSPALGRHWLDAGEQSSDERINQCPASTCGFLCPSRSLSRTPRKMITT